MRSEVSAFSSVDEAMLWIHTLMHKLSEKQLSQLLFYVERVSESKNEVTVVVIRSMEKCKPKDLIETFLTLPGGK